MRVAISTGGGDAPGLNAVIRSVTLCATRRGWEVIGIRDGFNGLMFPDQYIEGSGAFLLERHMVRGIVGTLLEVGSGKLDSSAVQTVLESRDRAKAGPNVAPYGLFFERAGYEPWTETEKTVTRTRDLSG